MSLKYREEKLNKEELEDEDFIISREDVSAKARAENDENLSQEEPDEEFEEVNEEIQEEAEETEEEAQEEVASIPQQEENEVSEKVETEVQEEKSDKYLDMARQIQADFENFRRHAAENVNKARLDGQASVIEVFLPCLDTFKEAKKSITDENVMRGVEMIEGKINEALKNLGVEKLPSIGQVYDPHIHESLAVMRDESKENDIILDEYQAGYKFNGKVLRYAKVIVNKL